MMDTGDGFKLQRRMCKPVTWGGVPFQIMEERKANAYLLISYATCSIVRY